MATKILDDGAEAYETKGGVTVTRRRRAADYANAISAYVDKLDERRGAVFSSNYEYPGRYTRWDTAVVDPPLGISSFGRAVWIEAYNARGEVLLSFIADRLAQVPELALGARTASRLDLDVKLPDRVFTEEERSKMPTVFTVLRAVTDLFHSAEDANLGLYGAFGYDLAFQFDAIELKLKRSEDQRDMVLFLPDEILVVDHHAAKAWIDRYDFAMGGLSTEGKAEAMASEPFQTVDVIPPHGDHRPGEYAELVVKAKESFRRGDLFEVVPGQKFFERCESKPSEISKRLKAINPSPYSFFINLGNQEYLVGASPEMFVRVSGRRIETCPISGTIKRGEDPIADSEQILKLLNSKKDESELTMCSDVDRNDKSRVCEPGSVKVIGRRQIEMYSRLIHTVDHIEGRLRDDMDAFDGFLSHAWAVTVTGAPKLWAMRFIEAHEKSPRAWYGGAIGMVGFNGDMNTGLTLRTIRIKDGIAEVRAGATLLYDSNPAEEEAETELKASAMIAAIRDAKAGNSAKVQRDVAAVGGRGQHPARRPRGQFCPHARELLPPDGRDCHDGAHAGAGRGVRPPEAGPRRAVARAGHAEGFRLQGDDQEGARPQPADLRRLPRPPGACRGLWRGVAPTRRSHAWQAVAHPRAGARHRLFRPWPRGDGRPLPFDLRRSLDPAAGFHHHGGERGRHDHGHRARKRAGGRGAVPPGIDHDARAGCRHADDRERGGAPLQKSQGKSRLRL